MKKFVFAAVVVGFCCSCTPTSVRGRTNTLSLGEIRPASSFFLTYNDVMDLTDRKLGDYIAGHFENQGYKRVPDAELSDFGVFYRYMVGTGNTEIGSSPNYATGGSDVYSYTTFPRKFSMTIIDIKKTQEKSPDGKKPVILWQGEVISSGTRSNIGDIGRYFIDELMENFGKTVDNGIMFRLTVAPGINPIPNPLRASGM